MSFDNNTNTTVDRPQYDIGHGNLRGWVKVELRLLNEDELTRGGGLKGDKDR
jgi:hypothetical protein